MTNTLWYSIIAVGVVLCIVAYVMISRKKANEKLRAKIAQAWGKEPGTKYTPELLNSISAYFFGNAKKNEYKYHIDDITWHDLDMDKVFARINNTQSTVGEEYLYSLLREPVFDEEVLKERERLISFFQSNKTARESLQFVLAKLGKVKSINISNYFDDEIKLSKRGFYYKLLSAAALLSPVTVALNPGMGIGIMLLSFITNMIVYYRAKNEIEAELEALSYIVSLIVCAKNISSSNIPEIHQYSNTLSKSFKTLKGIGKKSAYVLYKTQDVVIEYIKVVLLAELIAFEGISSTIIKYRDDLKKIYETVGLLDSLISIASYRQSISYYATPDLSKYSKDLHIQLKCLDIYHPLIKDPVVNSVEVDTPVLITGSNASGKSTFIKTVAINAIYSQTIHTCLAREYSSFYFMIFTSMALKDNLLNGESYYIAEIKSLKRILDSLNDDIPCLCMIDEVLRGTNTVERIAASSQILHFLSLNNCLCFAATHDIELTTILQHFFVNYHFREHFKDDEIVFDYKIYSGRSSTRNAIKLLKLMGYKDSIVNEAEGRASSFVSQGIWKGFLK
ncbi:MAG: DNA mismatch repair protein MutS [Clostridia bacterium]|nr:DNA mismatch repair protein MutS [Clostridia bacterium]